ncbi:MAG: prephenate dehydratase [Armatimonadota bacterium]|nr:prephenate dehydratase [Armatimonadota bacterium]MDR7443668.1 prephenate dehydratase [Armatimonadota bacterium]MDR7570394.1 prephenate dehydratase [Armatimonadota bacterium]MDR7613803.1 prephenate dehydratase [Armatimonadota bacterium]
MRRVAFQGEAGAYSEEAALQHFGPVKTVPRRTLREVFESVAGGTCEAGIVPVENSEAGSINETYDLLLEFHDRLTITGEISLRIAHCLLGVPGARLEGIRRVYSHPQALAQCEEFLRSLGVEPVPAYDTAGAARLVAARGEREEAAIASRRAADLYGLTVLAEDVHDNPLNTTRFLSIASQPVPRRDPSKTSVVFATEHRPGALYRALGAFAEEGLNLTKLESRPARNAVWEYVFYVDFEGHVDELRVQRALRRLEEQCRWAIVLGSYPAAP